MCNQQCNIPSDTKLSSKFAVTLTNGTIICTGCQDFLLWTNASGISEEPKFETKLTAPPKPHQPKEVKKTSSVMMINCPKCKSKFSEQTCSCGFKNPLFR